ncbi:PAS domain S-box protein [Hydrogenophaga sp.]|uniref:sensor histidine kinase n=1 Tax=Hydrogenophaga sp. TaxID=1904254 RepID=UPI0008BBA315|nr:PAS domain S-box protein [Hydrogenophaga sp.]OGA75589.1 MAG: hypothetical protein A2X73_04370 [Burkholderiales bacterium GWE1_65_30]OGA93716.1 MAG: hypothetical protein A2X72_21945 [Burkholderiales bacterium GWF1_66_17]MDP3886643.1 PAS domain-containing protein [Hydrogenophaga sp.]HAX20180.1 hypothetical protein [Hydrogenophaga sp.]HBU18522.1 hypothetical protein [Hydrogenophaga sp.]
MTPSVRHRRPLTLRLLPLLPALSTLLLLAFVLWANERFVAQDLAQRAQSRVEQTANVFADQVARVLARRTAELELLGPIVTLAPGQAPDALRALQRLQDTSTSYAGIALFDAGGHQLLATGDARRLTQWSPAADPGLRLLTPDTVPPAPGTAPPPLAVLVVPARSVTGEARGALVALLAQPYFEGLRQFALGDPAARRSLNLSLRVAGSTRLLGPGAPGEISGTDFAQAEAPVQTPDSHLVTSWTVTAFQPIKAAQGPALRLQQGLLLWGLTAALLIGGAGLWLSRRIARPYNELLDAVERSSVAQGPDTPGAYLQAVRAALQRLHPSAPAGLPDDPLFAGLLQDAQRLQTVIDELPSPVYLLGTDRRVTYWNRQAERVFGWSVAEAVGQPIAQLLPGDLPHQPADDASPIEVRTHHRHGAELWCELRLLALHDTRGQPTGQVALVRDVTERVHAASALALHQIELSELTQRLLEQEQRTSRQLAQTLHDQLGQTLSAIRLAYDALAPLWQAAPPGRLQQRAQALGQMIAHANAEVRQALIELRPPLLQEEGLAIALDNELHLRRADADPVQLLLHTHDAVIDQRWTPDVEYAAFMIAREAVSNALRHAGARQVQVHLGGDAQRLTLRVSDDGVGLAEELHAGRPGHLGLVGIRERALAIGALVEFLPASPQGLTVALRWPASPTILVSDLTAPPSPP